MVKNNWNENQAKQTVNAAGSNPADQQLALQAYASRLIGQDPTLVLHGGGNTSCKVMRTDLFGADRPVLHVKGSGHDLAKIAPNGMPGLWLEQLRALRALESLSDEDMVNALRGAMLDTTGANPSIETLLHAFLPHSFINHTHATAVLALADMKDAKAIVREIFGDTVAVVPYVKPGFDLAKIAIEVFDANADIQGLILLNHGHFAFADDPKTAYSRIIQQTNKVLDWLKGKSGKVLPGAGKNQPEAEQKATRILPILRGILGQANAGFTANPDAAMPVVDLRAGPNVQAFLARADLSDLAQRGVATPDHVIHTKNCPLHLTAENIADGKSAFGQAIERYIADYTAYFQKNSARHVDQKTQLLPTPNVIWAEGVGIIGMGQNAKLAGIAADLAEQNIMAMSLAQDCGGYFPLASSDLFDLEYWSLEQAKLAKNQPRTLEGQVVFITGGAGAIGLATAQAFAALGANTFLVDLSPDGLAKALAAMGPGHSGIAMDITEPGAAQIALDACILQFGGLDILVSNAGAAWTGEMASMDDALLRKSFELNFFAHHAFSQAAAQVFQAQNRGGQILFNVSKQAVNPGKGFGAYGLPKATTMFLLRQLALELGPMGVRVNGINADRIRSGLLDDAFIAKRSKARGIDEQTYMAGNLLNREVEAHHVANAFTVLAHSLRTTAHVLTVDGGNIEAALR